MLVAFKEDADQVCDILGTFIKQKKTRRAGRGGWQPRGRGGWPRGGEKRKREEDQQRPPHQPDDQAEGARRPGTPAGQDDSTTHRDEEVMSDGVEEAHGSGEVVDVGRNMLPPLRSEVHVVPNPNEGDASTSSSDAVRKKQQEPSYRGRAWRQGRGGFRRRRFGITGSV